MNKLQIRRIKKYALALSMIMAILSFTAPKNSLAIDDTFQPNASATVTCVDGKRQIKTFQNNAPSGSTVFLLEGKGSSGGVIYGRELKIEDKIDTESTLYWSIQDFLQGPWEVTTEPSTSCATIAKDSESKTLLYISGAGVLVVLGFVGIIIVKRKKN